MTNQSTDNTNKMYSVILSQGEYLAHLTIRLGEDFVGKDVIRFLPDAIVELEGADESSATYTRSTWTSGLASGAFYAFRSLQVPRRYVDVLELILYLRSSDMEAVANCATIAVASLVGKELPPLSTEGWTIHQTELDESDTTIEQEDAELLRQMLP